MNKIQIITEIKQTYTSLNKIITDNNHNKKLRTPLLSDIKSFNKLQLFNFTENKLYKHYTIDYLSKLHKKQKIYYNKLNKLIKKIGGNKMSDKKENNVSLVLEVNGDLMDEIGNYYYCIDTKDIEKVVSNYENIAYNINQRDTLEKYLKDNSEVDIYFLLDNDIITHLDDIITDLEMDVLDSYSKEIACLSDFETETVYRYWDGHNWKVKYIEVSEFKFDFNDKIWINLDEWDGRNWETGGSGCHCKITKLDDNFVTYEYSQYQGDIPVSRILETETELIDYLTDLNRLEYLEQIKNI